jgi:DNA-binding NtrC family response regulator
MYLPDGSGRTVLARALELAPVPAVLVMTGRAEIRGAVEAIRAGAADYLEKPLDLEDFGLRFERCLEQRRVQSRLAAYEAREQATSGAIVESNAIREVLAVAARVAATPQSSALILGESGVGKEVVTSYIHAESARSRGPFVRVNLAAIPETMIEGELFGSVRGAFTDAKRDRAGVFASAEGGTLLLDEICEFKIELQPKLLRVLESRQFFPVGSDRERRMNARVLAATNRDPREMIANGTLREDLYYRLATVVIRVPPLRERPEDIAPLSDHFVGLFRAEFGRPRATLTKDAHAALGRHGWPGNVRELRNVIERAMMLAPTDAIDAEHLDLGGRSAPPVAMAMPGTLEEMERVHIVRMLEHCGGSKAKAATMLGISRSTLWEKGKKFGLF